jgi:hypothetical protein
VSIRSVLIALLLVTGPAHVSAADAPNAVTEWATIVQQYIHNATAPRSAGTSQILHTMTVLAMYDAVMAVEGGYTPYAATIAGAHGADVRAAVATAAYVTARARVAASQVPLLDQHYAAYMQTIADGPAKIAGFNVGVEAATALLTVRANDGFSNIVLYECSAVPPPAGEFEPDTGCPSAPNSPQPVDVKLGFIQPFTLSDVNAYRPAGPDPLTSQAYADDFNETRDFGRVDSAIRSAEQTDIAYFWSENPYVHWNRNLVNLAVARGLDTRETARFFAMVHTAVSDAIIAGFAAKYHFSTWRPRTAIPRADSDGNSETDADPSWTPLLRVNHPEYPSGHGFWSGALLDAVAAYFGTRKLEWTINTSKAAVPAVVKTERTYEHLNVLMREIGDARIWGGLHWRTAIRDGKQMGHRVAIHVTRHYFRPQK